MAEFSKLVVPLDAPYIDNVIVYWKLIVFEYVPRLYESFLKYERAKALRNDMRIKQAKEQYRDAFDAYVSTVVSLISALSPYILYVYYSQRKRFEQYPDPVKEFITDILEVGMPKIVDEFIVTDPIEEYPFSVIVEDVKTLGLLLAELGIISPREVLG